MRLSSPTLLSMSDAYNMKDLISPAALNSIRESCRSNGTSAGRVRTSKVYKGAAFRHAYGTHRLSQSILHHQTACLHNLARQQVEQLQGHHAIFMQSTALTLQHIRCREVSDGCSLIFVSHSNRPEVGGRSPFMTCSHKNCQNAHLVMIAEVIALAGHENGIATCNIQQAAAAILQQSSAAPSELSTTIPCCIGQHKSQAPGPACALCIWLQIS